MFDNNGTFKTEIKNVGNAQAICITPGANQIMYVSNSNPPTDLDTAGDHAADAEPAVRPDPHGALRLEPLPGDRLGRVVVAMVGVADEAVVGEHHVVSDLDQLESREHRVAVEEAPLPDPDARLTGERQPATGFEQRALPDLEAPRVERLQSLSLDRLPDEEAALGGMAVQSQPPAPPPVALVPASLHPPGAPLARCRHVRRLTQPRVMVPA